MSALLKGVEGRQEKMKEKAIKEAFVSGACFGFSPVEPDTLPEKRKTLPERLETQVGEEGSPGTAADMQLWKVELKSKCRAVQMRIYYKAQRKDYHKGENNYDIIIKL